MLVDTKKRSKEEELMDDFDMMGDTLEKTLSDIAKLNKWLGGNKITINGIHSLCKSLSKDKTYIIADVGCGNGDMLREIALFGRKKGFNFKLIGVDANAFAINNAKALSTNFEEISYYCQNVFDDSFANQEFDIVTCTLTLHHFDDIQIKKLVTIFDAQTSVGIVVNDLQRSRLSYYLFRMICFFFIKNPMARYDGKISILRGFKKRDLTEFANTIKLASHRIRWRWAFRYQWIINKQ